MAARRAHARLNAEHAMLAEAATRWSATESIDRLLGEELIAAACDLLDAYQNIAITASDRRARRRFEAALDRLEELVGKP